MSLLRPQLVNRLLLCSTRSRQQLLPVAHTRWAGGIQSTEVDRSGPNPTANSSQAPAPPKGASEMVRQEEARESLVSHAPDYNAPIDHGTS